MVRDQGSMLQRITTIISELPHTLSMTCVDRNSGCCATGQRLHQSILKPCTYWLNQIWEKTSLSWVNWLPHIKSQLMILSPSADRDPVVIATTWRVCNWIDDIMSFCYVTICVSDNHKFLKNYIHLSRQSTSSVNVALPLCNTSSLRDADWSLIDTIS